MKKINVVKSLTNLTDRLIDWQFRKEGSLSEEEKAAHIEHLDCFHQLLNFKLKKLDFEEADISEAFEIFALSLRDWTTPAGKPVPVVGNKNFYSVLAKSAVEKLMRISQREKRTFVNGKDTYAKIDSITFQDDETGEDVEQSFETTYYRNDRVSRDLEDLKAEFPETREVITSVPDATITYWISLLKRGDFKALRLALLAKMPQSAAEEVVRMIMAMEAL